MINIKGNIGKRQNPYLASAFLYFVIHLAFLRIFSGSRF